MDLEAYIKEYKNITEKVTESLVNEKFEEISDLLNQREEIIKSIDKLNYKKDEFISIAKGMKLFDLDKEMNAILNEKKDEFENKYMSIRKNKTAANKYRKKFNVNPFYISKKIY